MNVIFAVITFLLCFTGLPAARRKPDHNPDHNGAKDSTFDVEQSEGFPPAGSPPIQDAVGNKGQFEPYAVGTTNSLVQTVQKVARSSLSFWMISAAVTAFACLGCYLLFRQLMGSTPNGSGNAKQAKTIASASGLATQSANQLTAASVAAAQVPPANSIFMVLIAVGGFVATEVSRTLITYHSLHSTGGSSKMTYDPSAVVLLAEAIKLIVAACFVLVQDGVAAWKEATRVFWPQGSVAALFALQNTINIYAIVFVGPTLFALLGQCKIIFTCLFMTLILGKKFSVYQQTAVVMLVIAVSLPEFGDRSSKGAKSSGDSGASYGFLFAVGLLLLVIAGVSSGLAAVMNEKILKDEASTKASFMLKNAMLYIWGLIFNFGAMAVKPDGKWFSGFGMEAFTITMLLAGTGLSIAWILKYMDNVVRCFASISTVFLTTILSVILFGDTLDLWVVSGAAVFCCAIILYMYNPKGDSKALIWQGLFSALMIAITVYLWSYQSASKART